MELNKESLSTQIQREIRNRIINVEISQGEKINVNELEEEFGVSRAPVREALKSLTNEGLVEVKPRVGYFAVKLTEKQVKEICEVRKLLEKYALEKSLNNIPHKKAKSLLDKSKKLKRNGHSDEALRIMFDETDEELHGIIIERAGNEILKDFTEKIHNLIGLTRHLNQRIYAAIDEHIALLEAILNGKEKEAKKALTEHLENVELEIIESLE